MDVFSLGKLKKVVSVRTDVGQSTKLFDILEIFHSLSEWNQNY